MIIKKKRKDKKRRKKEFVSDPDCAMRTHRERKKQAQRMTEIVTNRSKFIEKGWSLQKN